ncbi:MAG: hypothetical protein RLY20_3105 [Verrucomicrobiota bacterium]|jgi:hypothetical protein
MKTFRPLLFLSLALALAGCAPRRQCCGGPPLPAPKEKLLTLSATVDGSGRIVFTRASAHYEHKFWSPPWNVIFDGQPWTDLNRSPANWAALGNELDLSRARVFERKGRDVIALEPTADGFDLYLSDTPNGADDYAITLAIPWRK